MQTLAHFRPLEGRGSSDTEPKSKNSISPELLVVQSWFFGFCKNQRVLHGSLNIPDDSSVSFKTLKDSFSPPDTHFGRNLAKI